MGAASAGTARRLSTKSVVGGIVGPRDLESEYAEGPSQRLPSASRPLWRPDLPVPTTRLGRRTSDLRVLQRATAHIDDLNQTLDRQLAAERSEGERMRLLREATNQITRAANDGIQAYRRVTAAVKSEQARPDGAQADELARIQASLDAARQDLLDVLESTSRRYPWASEWNAAVAEVTTSEVSTADA